MVAAGGRALCHELICFLFSDVVIGEVCKDEDTVSVAVALQRSEIADVEANLVPKEQERTLLEFPRQRKALYADTCNIRNGMVLEEESQTSHSRSP